MMSIGFYKFFLPFTLDFRPLFNYLLMIEQLFLYSSMKSESEEGYICGVTSGRLFSVKERLDLGWRF